MSEEKKDFGIEYVAGLIISFIPALLLNGDNDNNYFLFSVIILLVNIFLFIRARKKTVNIYINYIISSAALAMSFWVFLHCMFNEYMASQEFILWLTRNNKELFVFNSKAFSFFIATFVLIVIAGVEVYKIKHKTMRLANYIFIGICSLIIIAYVVIFPSAIMSKATIKLSESNGELTAKRIYGELFHNGKFIEGYKDVRFEWYLDGQRISNGIPHNRGEEEKKNIGFSKGSFQVFLTPPKCEKCDKIKSNIVEL